MRIACALALLGLSACSTATPASRDAGAPLAIEPPPALAEVEPAPPPPVAAAPAALVARLGDVVTVGAGELLVGTAPGTPHRRPSVEADLSPLAIPGFDIDRLPYPNDPARPPHLAATRAEAAQLCAARGRRLCEELEWERACRGDTALPYPSGEALPLEACLADATACPSPTGVMDLGVRSPEWTASDAEPALARLTRTAVVRGAGADEPALAHRCGARQVRDPAGGGRALAFRCCGGAAPALSYPDVGERRLFRDLTLDDARWSALFASIPALAPYAEGFHAYGEAEALRALARGDATEADVPWELARAPFAWSPSPGEEVWVVAGQSGERTILAAIYPLPDGTARHAASFALIDEAAPLAVLRTTASRGELLWSTCWACMGESGAVRFQDDATIVIVQQ